MDFARGEFVTQVDQIDDNERATLSHGAIHPTTSDSVPRSLTIVTIAPQRTKYHKTPVIFFALHTQAALRS